MRTERTVLAAALGLGATLAWGQNSLPNPGFEAGNGGVTGWRLSGGVGRYQAAGGDPAEGSRWISVEGTGSDSNDWRTEDLRWEPGGLYRLSFWGRREGNATAGTAFAGPSRINRDFPLSDQWTRHSFVFTVDSPADYVRFGQWEVKGRVGFDHASLNRVLVAHTRIAPGLELGEGESIRRGVYRFAPDFNWAGANYHRPLVTRRAAFNSNRWLFAPGAELAYAFQLPGCTQQKAAVRVAINHHVEGVLRVEASRDGSGWVRVAEFDGQKRAGRTELPAAIFPADRVFIRLRQAEPGAGFQVDTLEYEAELSAPPADAEGATHFVDVQESAPGLAVALERVGIPDDQGGCRVELRLTNPAATPLVLRETHLLEGADQSPREGKAVRLGPGQTQSLAIGFPVAGAGERRAQFRLRDEAGATVFAGALSFRLSLLEDSSYGYALAGTKDLDLWWCESGWKVGRDRSPPPATRRRDGRAIRLAAARGEYEAVQVVLRPRREAVLRAASVAALRDERGRPSPVEVRFNEVAYVHVTQPTDGACVRGWYPDPLPPLPTPLALEAGHNQPLWVTVRVPAGARAGVHRGQLELATSEGRLRAPFEVRVYDFALPAETHLHSALGLGTHEINRYHRLTQGADQVAVFEKYLANFAAHRISPYSFYDYASFQVRFEGAGEAKRARVDFAAFDAAATKWLDEHHFSTFQLPLRGMGGGTFHSRHLGELEGFREGTPEHARLFQDYLSQVEQHLRTKGWLGKAFTYWFDEPDPKDYAFVVAGQQRIRAAAPGIRRMLTEQPEPELAGHVEIWCGLTPEWSREKVQARRAAGEEVWWYICTGPKAPYVTEFIDHPGTELRLWPWQSWQYGVSGILIWATVYWNGPLVYVAPTVQDPWADPMSWMSGYGNPVGTRSPWGNGDGRFLYPPRRDPNAATTPDLGGPINSLRWENLRDGMEDYEYLWLLDQERRRMAAAGHPELAAEAAALLTVPAEVSRDLTHFTTDPRPILAHRDKVARLIERLQGRK